MHLHFTNINDAFTGLVRGIQLGMYTAEKQPSRNGWVLQIMEPVTITYMNPRQRVLLNPRRDANPFFHLYESLWMLAGRNDVAPLDYYSSKYSSFCSDDGLTTNGAYGYRWRYTGLTSKPLGDEVDQLDWVIEHLKKNPTSRRAVLSMWAVEDDLLKIDSSKDVCCNTHVYFSLRNVDTCQRDHSVVNCPCAVLGHQTSVLDMTVCNRSNDMILGMLGANVVHFSFLQEYMASALGAGVGVYNQFTNNLHVYENNWKPEDWLQDHVNRTAHSQKLYSYKDVKHTVPFVEDKRTFDQECKEFVDRHSGDALAGTYQEPFLQTVAQPMCIAFHYHKRRQYNEALATISGVAADDWRIAGLNWIKKRKKQWEERNAAQAQQSSVPLESSSQ